MKKARQQLRLAECLVRVFDEIFTAKLNSVEAQKLLERILPEIAPQLSNSTISKICATLTDFQVRWSAIDLNESIKLNWNQKFPSKSLNP